MNANEGKYVKWYQGCSYTVKCRYAALSRQTIRVYLRFLFHLPLQVHSNIDHSPGK